MGWNGEVVGWESANWQGEVNGLKGCQHMRVASYSGTALTLRGSGGEGLVHVRGARLLIVSGSVMSLASVEYELRSQQCWLM